MLLPCLNLSIGRERHNGGFMTHTQKDDLKIMLAFGLCVIAASFVMGVFDGLDKAMEAQEKRNRTSVYCQQAGADNELCEQFKAGL